MALSIKNSKKAVLTCLEAGLTPILKGQPGIGKSAIMKEVASHLQLKLIDVRLAQCEPTDILGFPNLDREKGKASYMPMDIFPLETDEIPKGYNGWLLFLDELPNANVHVQVAAYRLILDREIGNNKLHDNCLIAAAGNREEDACFVQEMPAALKSRMVHLELEMNYHDWIDHAIKQGFDYRVVSFIGFAPDKLHSEFVDSDEPTYASPRTWEFVSKLIDGKTDLEDSVMRQILNGTVSSPVTTEFLSYVKYFDKVPSYKEIVTNPKTAKCPDQFEIGLIWATIAMLNNSFQLKDLGKVMTYVDRLPEEYQLIFVKYLATAYPSQILHHEDMVEWVDKIVDMLWS